MPNPGLAYKIAELLASTGPSSWPTAAAPANDVSLFAALRYIADAQLGTAGIASFPSGAVAANNVSMAEVLRYAQENINNGGTAMPASTGVYDLALAAPRCVAKTDGACLGTGGSADPIFTITGGPVRCRIFGLVTTNIGAGTTNAKYTITTTTPAATVDMSAAAVDIDADAAGTSYRSINTTAVFTPVTAGFVMMGNAFATNDTEFFCPIGTINFDTSAARAGVVAFYCEYTPLSPLSRVVAAA